MPCYDFKCTVCTKVRQDVYISGVETPELFCDTCKGKMEKMFPLATHTRIGKSLDGKDAGKVTQEKNELLRKRWAGYAREQQSLQKKLSERGQEKIAQASL